LPQLLAAPDCVLTKSEARAAARKIHPAALPHSRLFPDMLPLARQVQVACDFGSSVTARLAGAEERAFHVGDQSFDDLRQRIAATLAFVGGLDAAQH